MIKTVVYDDNSTLELDLKVFKQVRGNPCHIIGAFVGRERFLCHVARRRLFPYHYGNNHIDKDGTIKSLSGSYVEANEVDLARHLGAVCKNRDMVTLKQLSRIESNIKTEHDTAFKREIKSLDRAKKEISAELKRSGKSVKLCTEAFKENVEPMLSYEREERVADSKGLNLTA